MPKRTTIVTAIPYVNGTFHIGNILTDLAGDVTARYHRMRGENVFFVAGTDENGLKILEAAKENGKDPLEFVAEMAGRFEAVLRESAIEPDEFIRTTQPAHVRTSQEFFRVLKERGHVYEGKYEGWYDVSTETFYREADLVDGKSPDGNPVRWVSEQNYFFKLSAFEKALLAHIEANPQFIVPEVRRNEVLSFIKQGLRDIAISRQNIGWGIPVEPGANQVIYVWFDALINYVTATGWPDPGWEDKWPPIVQWLGKDILTRFHATLWPAMLMGVGLPLPEVVAAHAWIVMGSGEKLSKSKGNIVTLRELAEGLRDRAGCTLDVAVDATRSYLISTMPFETDSAFTHEEFDRRYNSDLANDLGNALNRTLAMAHKFVGARVPDVPAEAEALEAIETAKNGYAASMISFRLDKAHDAAFGLVRFLNKYIDSRAPWALAKAGDPAVANVLKSMLLCIRSAGALVSPVMPNASKEIAKQLGLPPLEVWAAIGADQTLPSGNTLGMPHPIFPRLDLSAAKQPPRKEEPKKQPMEKQPEQSVTEITIEDFAKVQLRVGRVLEAEPLEGADKLLKLQVMVGNQQRQIVAGIRKNHKPEDLIGRQVIVVANLKPAKLRGTESQGMLLAAIADDGGAILLQPDSEAPEGALVR